ncbi:MAG: hypothetical protein J7513_12340 [Solirubrobacteraceae bacterium]|nr:hypothetical protein [Solirubrobacteraceae bacterium]
MRRHLLMLALASSAAAGLAACGDGPTPSPSVGRPAMDPSGEPYPLPTGGQIDMPASWTTTPGPAGGPQLVRSVSGQGQIVVWQYQRTEPLPTSRRNLRNTRRSLRNAITARDPNFKFTAALLRRVPQPAVEIAGLGTLAGARRSIRSLHVYADGRETVVDCIGPVTDSAAFNTTVCEPVLDSLTLG